MTTLRTRETKKNKKIVELAALTDAPIHSAQIKPAPPKHTFANNDARLKTPIKGANAVVKRLSDLIIGGIALLLLSPFLALIAILIKLDSAGPVVFHQQRQGRNRKAIKVYKFRTMYQNYCTPVPTSQSFIQAKKDDRRVTRIGGFLRKTSIDELPQLLNVMQGTMSLVGPRPHPAPLDEQFAHVIPTLNSRYTIKPGLTGWAQVHGLRGQTVRIEDMAARVKYDQYYIENWSLWLDVKIIASTALMGWTHRNAY